MANELKDALSPYLQQHKDNPVNWRLWSEANLELARRENKPIFLSIGYSSCHWCHVMERECFSDPEIADVLNRHFIPIKVDREERPDLDHIYMQSLQMMTGQGGWPLNIFLTPDLRPFFGGTYFPKEARYGRPPFKEVILRLHEVFQNQRDLVDKNANQIVGLLAQSGQFFTSQQTLSSEVTSAVVKNVRASIDPNFGGLGGAPKFFHVDGLRLLLRTTGEKADADRALVQLSLEKMAGGGVYDHVAGGFHRYSTDAAWRVPHFEKMLYDNALLALLFVEAYDATDDDRYQRVAGEILDWALREMRNDQGLFYSAIDADAAHIEGAYYVWTHEELQAVVAESDFEEFTKTFNILKEGNFEKGQNILYTEKLLSTAESQRWQPTLKKLFDRRSQRERPLTDTKIQTSWNALMITALARAAESFDRQDYRVAAERAADQLLKSAWNGIRLSHCQMDGRVLETSFLEDAAYFLDALTDLAIRAKRVDLWDSIVSIAHYLIREYYDKENGGFWTTVRNQRDLLVRTKEIHDGALPAAYHVALCALNRIYSKTADKQWYDVLERSIKAILGEVVERPGGFHRFALVYEKFMASNYACADGECSVSGVNLP